MHLTIDIPRNQFAALKRAFRTHRETEDGAALSTGLLEALMLQLLAAAETDAAHDKPAGVCRRCGCTDRNGCPQGCGWAEANLCTACLTWAEGRALARRRGAI